MTHIHLKDYTKNDFILLTKQNIYKLNWIYSSIWDKMPYDQYLSKSQQSVILAEQMKLINSNKCISVLNTSLFLVLDYYGNKTGFYDSVVNG